MAALAAGYLLAAPAVAALGLLALSAAALLLTANVLRTVRAAPRPLTLPARLLVAGQLYLGLGSALAAALAPADPSEPFGDAVREGLALLLGAGWIGLTVGGSLLHLLPVLAGRPGRLPRPIASPLAARWLPRLAGAGVALSATGAFLGLSPLSTLGGAGIALTFGAVALVIARLSAAGVRSAFRRRLASHP